MTRCKEKKSFIILLKTEVSSAILKFNILVRCSHFAVPKSYSAFGNIFKKSMKVKMQISYYEGLHESEIKKVAWKLSRRR